MTPDLDALARRLSDDLARQHDPAPRASDAPSSDTPPPAPPGVIWAPDDVRIASLIDHTLLKPEATEQDIVRLCAEAREHRFAAVCVNPAWVPLCRKALDGTEVKVATVIGFPLGANRPEVKAAEAALAVHDGADELDMVAAIGHLRSGRWAHVQKDIERVVEAADGRLVKVIIESALLAPLEIVRACLTATAAGAGYVKTSTGFNAAGGATAEAVALMRLAVGDALGVKASGGVRDCDTALRMIAAGATRIGTSSGVAMAGCRGAGPAPVRDLLARRWPHAHRDDGASRASDAPPSARPY
ncbi:MAG TPA: deoxyribose-phosphate aldolase [Gemmatimonadaceae bacterium]